jgi:N-methylhydantoinase A
MKVGPESAGAEPGPASYGRGGTEPAVTDADVVLGLLDPDAFLGGDMPLDKGLAESAVGAVGQSLGLTVLETAAGIHEIVNQNMAAAARMHGVEMGVDLRGVPLIAFGGAGPVHACGVADLLESDRVIFPVNASVLSAFGTLVSPVRIDLARSLPRPLSTVDPSERDSLLEELRVEGRRVLSAAGVPDGAVRFRYGIDARYAGQGNEITIWVGEGDAWSATVDSVRETFDAEYSRIYGMTIPDVEIEAVTWRLSAFATTSSVEPDSSLGPADGAPTPISHRPMTFVRGEGPIDTPVYRRLSLGAGARFDGPAVVEERETTSVIRPGWSVEVAADGSLIATRGEGNAS